MNAPFLNKLLTPLCMLLYAIPVYGQIEATGDTNTQSVYISLPEPVVSRTIVEASDKDTAEARGLHLFSISGDAAHPPIADWRDQDKLEIKFPVGTDYNTEYKLTFHPSTCYLSGEELKERTVNFRCPPDRLKGEPLMTADGWAVMVWPEYQNSHQARQFSPATAVQYEFCQVKHTRWSRKKYYGRRVAAIVHPARVCDGITEKVLEHLQKRGEKAWKSLREDSIIPGCVIVRPIKELPTDEEWELVYAGAEKSGIDRGNLDQMKPYNEWATSVDMKKARPYATEVEMMLSFQYPVAESQLPDIFARLRLRLDGKGKQTTSPDGLNHKVTVDSKTWLNFRYAGALSCKTLQVYADCDTLPENSYLAHQRVGLATGMRIVVSGVLPAVVDVCLPAGLTAANGSKTRTEHNHRITLAPTFPELGISKDGVYIMPLHGKHELSLPINNVAEVSATLRRVAPELAPAVYFGPSYDTRSLSFLRYCYNIDLLRARRNLPRNAELSFLWENLKDFENTYKEARKLRALWLKTAQTYGTQRTEYPHSAMLAPEKLRLNLDQLAGRRLKPGLYVLTLHTRSNQHVRYNLTRNKQTPDFLNDEVDIPILVTNLNPIVSANGTIITRLSDGALASQASLSTYTDTPQASETQLVARGGVWFGTNDCDKLIARLGDDMAPAHKAGHTYGTWTCSDETKCSVLTDRPMYRPGETVHVRGLVRRLSRGRAVHAGLQSITLTVNRPNGEQLLTQQLSLGAYGAFTSDITLPDGEEDVCGNYEIRIKGDETLAEHQVPCQVFRRDAFAATLTAELPKIAPQALTLRVQADDYSGVPLSSARVRLKVKYEDEDETEHLLTTDATGQATLSLPLTTSQRERQYVIISGSVCNDREELVTLELQRHEFHAADFRINYDSGRITLTDAENGKPLAEEQAITVRLDHQGYTELPKRASFGYITPTIKTLATAEVVVPAHCHTGVPIPPAILSALNKNSLSDLSLLITGADSSGRVAHYCEDNEYNLRHICEQNEIGVHTEYREGKLNTCVTAPRAGMAQFVLGSAKGLRRFQQQLQQGENKLDIDLRKDEDGTVSLSVLLPASQGNGLPGSCIHGSHTCFVPVNSQHLDVILSTPKAPIRPGQTMTISGQVLSQGQPANTEVTLYAVDAGMLSVAKYDSPDPERFFANDSAPDFTPWFVRSGHRDIKTLNLSLMSNVWEGNLHQGASAYLSRLGIVRMIRTWDEKGMYFDFIPDEELPPWLLDEDAHDMKIGKKPLMTAGLRSGYSCAPAPVPCMALDEDEKPILRSNFAPVAVWQAALRTDADGCFTAEAKLPDSLTTYRVFAVAADRSGKRFGMAEQTFTVNLPVMLTPGMPLFMSTGDSLDLPLTIINNTEAPGHWQVSLSGEAEPQDIELPAKATGTLYFNVRPQQEGECCLQWQATGSAGTDAVQGTCNVRYPAPLLKEVHHLELQPGQTPVSIARLFAPELAQSTRAKVQVELSASPLLHLKGCVDFLLESTYSCSQQKAIALMPWLLYDELSPFCPRLAATASAEAQQHIKREIEALFSRQCADGGISYWKENKVSSPWCSAYVAMVLTIAQERGHELPQDKMKRLLRYINKSSNHRYASKFMTARALGHKRAMRQELTHRQQELRKYMEITGIRPGLYGAHIDFMLALQKDANVDQAFKTWLRTIARDYRHDSCEDSTIILLALHDYLRKSSIDRCAATVQTNTGRHELSRALFELPLPTAARIAELHTTLASAASTVYATVRLTAYPEQIEYPGVSEKGLQVTRLYEVQGKDGNWHPAPSELCVGDVVRVTLTCAKIANDAEYLVLEDYLPSSMEAITPAIPSQSAGLEACVVSPSFDHKEYLADRVRAFCTRWSTCDLLNMSYYARVKRAGTATAPPAHAQLMYEPQIYGLSPNTKLITRPAQ